MYSRSNKRAVAEAGGVQVVLDLIGSGDTDTLIQATMFINLLFSNKTIQEYASSETVRAITAAIEKDLWATGTVHEEYLKALNELFGNFPRLRASEPATLSIPHLVTSLKTGSEATQEAALDALFIMRLAWSACPADVSRSQSNLRIIFTPYETTEVTLPSFLLATSLPKKSIKVYSDRCSFYIRPLTMLPDASFTIFCTHPLAKILNCIMN
ncbi:protein CELLULOSE SYNTHASE INTERACTIVE 1-like [Lactuca sativa]|uniref:protein CELLULOSE SYNTHASE INTERACTIVE 1-like n=1 Tax=Lactuca sativa TaxID=4236 RepID=UPI0022AE5B43|nr:protein CELLULOSE SYNTHASE INTERACTIVE 1-like [Lactuca sativa]